MRETVAVLPPEVIEEAVARALAEDRADADATTRSLPQAAEIFPARIIAKEPLVVCGLPLAEAAFRARGDTDFLADVKEGTSVAAGTVVAEIAAAAATILTAERVALNFLQRLSGIATLARDFVSAVPAGSRLRILDTRKTTPGLRDIEKYAVRVGGATNHRRDLADAVMLKENHLAVAGGIESAVRAVRARFPEARIICEVTDLEGVEAAVRMGVARILLDNFADEGVAEAMELIGDSAETEVSGGVTIERIPRLAALGVSFVSVGALTHSARARDLSLEILPPK